MYTFDDDVKNSTHANLTKPTFGLPVPKGDVLDHWLPFTENTWGVLSINLLNLFDAVLATAFAEADNTETSSPSDVISEMVSAVSINAALGVEGVGRVQAWALDYPNAYGKYVKLTDGSCIHMETGSSYEDPQDHKAGMMITAWESDRSANYGGDMKHPDGKPLASVYLKGVDMDVRFIEPLKEHGLNVVYPETNAAPNRTQDNLTRRGITLGRPSR